MQHKITLRPTGAPQPVEYKRFSLAQGFNVGTLKGDLHVNFTAAYSRELAQRIERVLKTELTRCAQAISHQLTAYTQCGPSFKEWRAAAERRELTGVGSDRVIIDDPFVPRTVPHNALAWYREFMYNRNIARATGVPRALLESSPKKEKSVKKIRNRFYVAAPSITSEREQAQPNVPGDGSIYLNEGIPSGGGQWTRPTMQAAIEHAQQILEKDRSRDHVAIVQVVRIVRRKAVPVTVETVK